MDIVSVLPSHPYRLLCSYLPMCMSNPDCVLLLTDFRGGVWVLPRCPQPGHTVEGRGSSQVSQVNLYQTMNTQYRNEYMIPDIMPDNEYVIPK